ASASGRRLGTVQGHAGIRQQLRGPTGECLTGERGGHAFGVAVQEHHAELMLEVADLPRERRLRDVQLRGGTAQASGPRYRNEVPQVPQVHRVPPLNLCAPRMRSQAREYWPTTPAPRYVAARLTPIC